MAGLHPGSHPSHNGAEWVPGSEALGFDDPGIAFTEPFAEGSTVPHFADQGLTIELVIEAGDAVGGGFAFVVCMHNGDDSSQLLLGQWKSTLILMNGDDYDHSRRLPRVAIELGGLSTRPNLITCISGADGTRIFVNGELRATRKNWRASVPGGGRPSRMLLGSSAYGSQPWKGKVMDLALWERSLASGEVNKRHAEWKSTGRLPKTTDPALVMLVPFDEGRGEIARDLSGNGHHLMFPGSTRFLQRRVFEHSSDFIRSSLGLRRDVFLNLVGFVPLGFVLMRLGSGGMRHAGCLLLAVTGGGFLLSAGIEFIQSWFPERTSSALDLLFNTLGTALGAVCAMLYACVAVRGLGSREPGDP